LLVVALPQPEAASITGALTKDTAPLGQTYSGVQGTAQPFLRNINNACRGEGNRGAAPHAAGRLSRSDAKSLILLQN